MDGGYAIIDFKTDVRFKGEREKEVVFEKGGERTCTTF